MIGLKDKYQSYFKIGAAVNTKTIETHADLIKKHFNCITCENETKFGSIQRHKDSFNFTKADKIVQFARDILPNTDLYYNDYNEVEIPKRDKIFEVVKSMKDRGIQSMELDSSAIGAFITLRWIL